MLMLDSSSCMLVRSEETQPWRADDALESMAVGSLFVWIYPSISIGIASGAFNSLNSSIVNIRSRPAFLRLNPGRVSPTVCKQASDGDLGRRANYRPTTHLTSTPSTDIPHHSQCLSSARSSPSKLVSSRKRPCEKEREGRGAGAMEPRKQGKDTLE